MLQEPQIKINTLEMSSEIFSHKHVTESRKGIDEYLKKIDTAFSASFVDNSEEHSTYFIHLNHGLDVDEIIKIRDMYGLQKCRVF